MKLNFYRNEFDVNIAKLVLGTGMAQILPIALMPILTRIYPPEAFGVFAVYMAVAGVLGVVATGRYELAIVLPKHATVASDIFWLCIIISGCLAAVSAITLAFFNELFVRALNLPDGSRVLYLIPVSIFFAGTLQALNYLFVRNKLFGRLSVSKVVMSSAGVSTQASLGLSTNMMPYGLTLGYILSQISSVCYLLFRGHALTRLENTSAVKIKAIATNYKKYPLVSAPSALCDTAALQLPLLLINKFFSSYTAGQFTLAMRIINVPLALIGAAVSQVLLEKMASADRNNPEEVRGIVLVLALKMAVLISPLCILSFNFGEEMFVIVFGEEWRIAGGFAFPLSLIVSFRFIVSPLSAVLSVERNLKYALLWQAWYFLSTLTVLLYATQFSIDNFLFIFVMNELVSYTLYFILIIKGTSTYRLADER